MSFIGWNTQADGKGTTYSAGASYTIDAPLTLYAKWTDNLILNNIEYSKTSEKVTWYDAVAFCNELTKLTMNESDCVYIITNKTQNAITKTITAADVIADYTKAGYRLPTEAEWEYAARGGNADSPEWGYAYAGVQTDKSTSAFITSPYNDEKLDDFGWNIYNSGDSEGNNPKTHEVGKLQSNTLGLYDMSGNVWEWCYDWYDATVSTDTVINPFGASSGTNRVARDGSWFYIPCACSVSRRSEFDPSYSQINLGFRVCRSFSVILVFLPLFVVE